MDRSETIAQARSLTELRDLFPRRDDKLDEIAYGAWEIWDAIKRAAILGGTFHGPT
jgi:hypothetical protein